MEYNFFNSSNIEIFIQLSIVKQIAEFIFYLTAPILLFLISFKLSKLIHKANEIILNFRNRDNNNQKEYN